MRVEKIYLLGFWGWFNTIPRRFFNRAAARSELKDNEGALADYEQAIKANPNVVEIYLQRGELLARLGDKDAAVRDYGEVLRLDPKDSRALLLRAQALKENGDFAGASKDFDQYLKFNSSSLPVRRERKRTIHLYTSHCSVNDNKSINTIVFLKSHIHIIWKMKSCHYLTLDKKIELINDYGDGAGLSQLVSCIVNCRDWQFSNSK